MARSTRFCKDTLLLSCISFLVFAPRIPAEPFCAITYRTIHQQPISINTDVLFNTTFFPAQGIAITVTNAPTSFHGVTTFCWTESRTGDFQYVEASTIASTAVKASIVPSTNPLTNIAKTGTTTAEQPYTELSTAEPSAWLISTSSVQDAGVSHSPLDTMTSTQLHTNSSFARTFSSTASSALTPGAGHSLPSITTTSIGAIQSHAASRSSSSSSTSLDPLTSTTSVVQQESVSTVLSSMDITTVTGQYLEASAIGFSSQTTSTAAEETSYIIVAMGSRQIEKRQSGSYFVNANGTISNDCTTAPIYTLSNGTLTAKNGSVLYTYSTEVGVGFAKFVPSTVPGSITTTFSLGGNQQLSWQNPAFFNGQASFCALSNGTVYAVFQQNAVPDGCLYIQLSLFTVSSCQGISLATITGPPGPSGPSGPTGVQGLQGTQGPTGATGVQGIQGAQGPTGATGIQGSQGPTGATGVQGIQGIQGPTGATGVQGIQGIQGSQGPTGATGVQGIQGIQGPTGATGGQGIQGIQGSQGPTGATGVQGLQGIQGPTGATGVQGPSGPTGPVGASASPGILYGYVGCYVQTGGNTSTTGLALSTYRTTYTSYVDSSCSKNCLLAGFIFFGTVNQGTTSGDCWCGNSIAYVTSQSGTLGLGTVTGEAGENNCYPCNGGALTGGVPGECGNFTVGTISIFARSF